MKVISQNTENHFNFCQRIFIIRITQHDLSLMHDRLAGRYFALPFINVLA